MAKVFDSHVGHGNYRLTRYKGQLIGIEIWPDPKNPADVEEPRAYWVQRFPYRSQGPAARFVRRVLRRG